MKKYLAFLLLFPSVAYATPPVDLSVHLDVAQQEETIACQIRDDIDTLAKLSVRVTDFQTPFADTDFVGTSLSYLTAYNANALLNTSSGVVYMLTSVLAANGNQGQTILEQMCGD